MKKLFILFVLGLGLVCADDLEFKGVINKIDAAAKTILVNNVVIQVLPQTHIKLDDCGIFGIDIDGKFSDLEIGAFVEVEAWPSSVVNDAASTQASYIASEIEQKCIRNRAY